MRRTNGITTLIASIATLLGTGCNGRLVVGDETGPWVTCTSDRSVKLVIDRREWSGMQQATTDSNGGYYLYAGESVDTPKLTRIDASGEEGETITVSSVLGPWIAEVVPTPDGGAFLTGSVSSLSGRAPWVGKMDTEWKLAWETIPDVPATELIALSDGGAVVTGYLGDPDNDPTGVSWARLDAAGNVMWERSLPLAGLHSPGLWGRRLSTTSNGIRILAATDQGIELIQGTLDGTWTHLQLDSALSLDVTDSAALPDGRLAFASTRASGAVLTMLGADGTVEWEKLFGQNTRAQSNALAYNPARNELLLGGTYRGVDGGTMRTWMVATDLEGNQTWQMVRTPIDTNLDGYVTSGGDDQGPPITDIAVQPDGSFIATGQTTNLSYFVVSAGDCQ